jgi:hypothetical protein
MTTPIRCHGVLTCIGCRVESTAHPPCIIGSPDRTDSALLPRGGFAADALAKTGPVLGLTPGTCRTIVVNNDKCLLICRFSRGRLQSVSRGLQRQGSRSPPGRAVVSCAEAERAGQFFRIWPDATISIARITDSEQPAGGNGATRARTRKCAESYRLVTAGDGMMAPVGHMGISTTSSFGAPRPDKNNARIATPIQEERPHQCPHALQRPSRY